MKRSKAVMVWCSLLSLLLWAMACPGGQPSDELTVRSYGGGAWQEAHKKAFLAPFSIITGVKYHSTTWNSDFGQLKNEVESGKPPADVVEVSSGVFVRGKNEHLFTRIAVPLEASQFVPGAIDDYGIGNVFWATVLAYDGSKWPTHPPLTWRDFWDVRRFPGGRALYDDPRGNLEIALLASGVPKDSLYPLNVDRAFQWLDSLRPYVRKWWTDGSEPIQLIENGQVTMSTAWNGRLFAARNSLQRTRWSFRDAPVDLAYWVIPKGAANPVVAQRFIWFASQAYSLAAQAELVGYGPSNLDAVAFLPDSISNQLPTSPANRLLTFRVDAAWWAANDAMVQRRWLAWKSSPSR